MTGRPLGSESHAGFTSGRRVLRPFRLVVLFALVSCAGPPPPGGGGGQGRRSDAVVRLESEGLPSPISSADRRWWISARPTAGDVRPVGEPFDLVLALEPRQQGEGGRDRLATIEIDVDATMPQHGHGMSVRPTIERTAPGRYVVHGLELSMEGEWRVTVDIREGRWTERAEWWIEGR